ncbi:hypothetical protein [Micromonospora tulbaghiae]|uniref:hypothetical protein n=1 Tax=Micromonospora tulbaghiae TaxID=479978 RepID=UPI001112DD2C|nr:hypothetical protein [Micromonospora tulbaghiae]
MRLQGYAPLGDVGLAEAERVAELIGRTVGHVDTADGHTLTLGWPTASEPAPNRRAPRLVRRELRESAVRTLVVAYAMLTDPRRTPSHSELTAVTVARVVEQSDALFGTSSWTTSALRRDLLNARLLAAVEVDLVTLGPAALSWGRYQRQALDLAASRLYASPLWIEVASA